MYAETRRRPAFAQADSPTELTSFISLLSCMIRLSPRAGSSLSFASEARPAHIEPTHLCIERAADDSDRLDPWSPSTRYRALQHVPRLHQLFRSVAISLPGDLVERAPGRVGQFTYVARHGPRYVQRAIQLHAVVESADAVFVQRGLYVIGPDAIVKSINRCSVRSCSTWMTPCPGCPQRWPRRGGSRDSCTDRSKRSG